MDCFWDISDVTGATVTHLTEVSFSFLRDLFVIISVSFGTGNTVSFWALYFSINTINYIEENVAKLGDYYMEFFTSGKIRITGKNTFNFFDNAEKLQGIITDENLSDLKVNSLEELLLQDVNSSIIFTNYTFGDQQCEQKEAYYINLQIVD